MVSWSAKRQSVYLLLFFGFIAVLIALPAFLIFYDPPSCSDKIQNQGEFGVDCGGPCALLCPAKAAAPIVHWWRVFEIAPGVWSSAAYIENPNLDSGSYNAPYLFKLYDENNILVAERRGRTFIPPRKIFVVYEGSILTGERSPVRALFQFADELTWRKDIPQSPDLRVSNRSFVTSSATPRVEADLVNPTLNRYTQVEVVVVVYDAGDNALGVSKTMVDSIEKGESKKLVFTWQKPFAASPSRIEAIVRVFPQ